MQSIKEKVQKFFEQDYIDHFALLNYIRDYATNSPHEFKAVEEFFNNYNTIPKQAFAMLTNKDNLYEYQKHACYILSILYDDNYHTALSLLQHKNPILLETFVKSAEFPLLMLYELSETQSSKVRILLTGVYPAIQELDSGYDISTHIAKMLQDPKIQEGARTKIIDRIFKASDKNNGIDILKKN